MTTTTYRDLAEFGLPFITPDNSTFAALAREIQTRPQPFGPGRAVDLSEAAVLVNDSGKSIVALACIWRYTTANGETRSSHYSNLCSSMQMDVLTGRRPVARDRASFILPGSRRLITQDGVFGDNLDVLAADPALPGGGWIGGTGGSGTVRRRRSEEEITRIGLQLDVVFFDDGLCVGPDESGLFEGMTQNLERQRQAAGEIVEALRSGASAGRVFEILRPLARRGGPQVGVGRSGGHHPGLLPMFAQMAISHLVNASDTELLAWFEEAAQPFAVQLRRPA
jgi:hypothetical protein